MIRSVVVVAVSTVVIAAAGCSTTDDSEPTIPPAGSELPDPADLPDSSDPADQDDADSQASDAEPPVDLVAAPPEDLSGDQSSPTGSNGLRIAADGTIWLADLRGNQILNVDAESGEVLRRFPAPEGAGPDDVAIDGSGRVFWTGFIGGHVGRIDPSTGEHVIVAEVGVGANPVTVAPDGRLIVGRAMTGEGLYDVDPEGTRPPRQIVESLDSVNAFEVTDEGILFGPRPTGELVRVDLDTGSVTVVADGLGAAFSVRQRVPGELWTLRVGDGVQLIRLDLAEDTTSASVGTEIDLPTQIADNFAVIPDGDGFLVSLFDRGVIMRVGLDGTTDELPIGTGD